jgi:hypothetical protein
MISPEQLKEIKEDCYLWANNCGGCETCERMFINPPLYDHQETLCLISMIENRDKKIKDLEDTIKCLNLATGNGIINTRPLKDNYGVGESDD